MQIKIIGFDYDKWEFTNHKLFIIFTLSVKIRRYQNIFIFWSIPYGIMLSRSTDLVIMQLLYRTSIIMVPSTMVYSRSNEHTLDKTVNTFYAAQGGGAVAEVRARGPLSPPSTVVPLTLTCDAHAPSRVFSTQGTAGARKRTRANRFRGRPWRTRTPSAIASRPAPRRGRWRAARSTRNTFSSETSWTTCGESTGEWTVRVPCSARPTADRPEPLTTVYIVGRAGSAGSADFPVSVRAATAADVGVVVF